MPTRHRMSSVSALILIALVILLLPLLAVPVAAAAPGDTLWWNTYSGGAKADAFVDVARAPSGDLYAVGTTKATEEVSTLLLVKYDASGTKLWARTFTWPGRAGSAGAAVAVTSSGRVVVAGSIGISPLSDPLGRDIVVLSYSAAGRRDGDGRAGGAGPARPGVGACPELGAARVELDQQQGTDLVGGLGRADCIEVAARRARDIDVGVGPGSAGVRVPPQRVARRGGGHGRAQQREQQDEKGDKGERGDG